VGYVHPERKPPDHRSPSLPPQHSCPGIQSRPCQKPSDCGGCLGLYTCKPPAGTCTLKAVSRQRGRLSGPRPLAPGTPCAQLPPSTTLQLPPPNPSQTHSVWDRVLLPAPATNSDERPTVRPTGRSNKCLQELGSAQPPEPSQGSQGGEGGSRFRGQLGSRPVWLSQPHRAARLGMCELLN